MAQVEGGLGNELLDVGLDPAAYEALEKDFQEVSNQPTRFLNLFNHSNRFLIYLTRC